MNHKLNAITRSIADVAGYAWQKGWAERNSGNISVNVSHLVTEDSQNDRAFREYVSDLEYQELNGMSFIVSGTGRRMRDLAKVPEENLCLIKITGQGNKYRVISNSKTKEILMPTSELQSHLAIHEMIRKNDRGDKVVLHFHVSELIALTQISEYKNEEKLNRILTTMIPETVIFLPKGIGFVPYEIPGTREIAESTVQSFEKHDVVIWEKHGVIAVGDNIEDTFDKIDLISKSAQVFFLCRNAGCEPEGLTEIQVGKLKDLYVH